MDGYKCINQLNLFRAACAKFSCKHIAIASKYLKALTFFHADKMVIAKTLSMN